MSRDSDGGQTAEIINLLKNEARKLHKDAVAGNNVARKRMLAGSAAVALGADLQRKHALGAIAREIGFSNWKAVLDCFEEKKGGSWEEFLYPKRCHIHWNIWCATYEEARRIHDDHDGYLLPYKHQFMIVDADYVKSLGVKPDCEEWALISRDWFFQTNLGVRMDLALLIIREHLKAAESSAA